jgi:hypothetical protein
VDGKMAALKALVIFMGVLIVIGAGALGYIVWGRMTAAQAAKEAADRAAQTPPAPFNRAMTIPPGTEVEDIIGVGDKLVLRVSGPAMQTRLLMIDAAHGTLLGTLDVISMSPPNPAPATEEK